MQTILYYTILCRHLEKILISCVALSVAGMNVIYRTVDIESVVLLLGFSKTILPLVFQDCNINGVSLG